MDMHDDIARLHFFLNVRKVGWRQVRSNMFYYTTLSDAQKSK
jgi:hypothetical protein